MSKKQFTQEQAQVMYEALQRIDKEAPKTIRIARDNAKSYADDFFYVGALAFQTLAAIDSDDSTEAEPQAKPKNNIRYDIREVGNSFFVVRITHNVVTGYVSCRENEDWTHDKSWARLFTEAEADAKLIEIEAQS